MVTQELTLLRHSNAFGAFGDYGMKAPVFTPRVSAPTTLVQSGVITPASSSVSGGTSAASTDTFQHYVVDSGSSLPVETGCVPWLQKLLGRERFLALKALPLSESKPIVKVLRQVAIRAFKDEMTEREDFGEYGAVIYGS